MPLAFQPVPSTVEIVLEFSQEDGEFAENVFHYFYGADDGPITLSSFTALHDNMMLPFFDTGIGGASALKTFTQELVTLENIKYTDLTTADGITATKTVGIAGTNDSEPLPQGVTFAVTHRTALRGRSFRGRTFIVGVNDGWIDADPARNTVKPDIITPLIEAFQELYAIGIEGNTDPATGFCVVSRFNQDAVPDPPHRRATAVTTPITSFGYHDLFLDYQRRRSPGHNRHH